MIEALKHFFGFCGEPHPSLLTLIVPIMAVFYWVKSKVFGKKKSAQES